MLEMYGTTGNDGSFAANCLLARRLAERGVRFIQLYHRDWDMHSDLKRDMQVNAKEVDRATAALIKDLKQRGFKFVGSTICYAFMQAAGMVNDHTVDCFRYRQLM